MSSICRWVCTVIATGLLIVARCATVRACVAHYILPCVPYNGAFLVQEYYQSILKKLKEVGASSRQSDFYV